MATGNDLWSLALLPTPKWLQSPQKCWPRSSQLWFFSTEKRGYLVIYGPPEPTFFKNSGNYCNAKIHVVESELSVLLFLVNIHPKRQVRKKNGRNHYHSCCGGRLKISPQSQMSSLKTLFSAVTVTSLIDIPLSFWAFLFFCKRALMIVLTLCLLRNKRMLQWMLKYLELLK